MTIMFFIFGLFLALRSLEHHSRGSFWKGKWLRIGLPWIVGTLLLAPHVSYIMVASRGMEIPSYIEFYRTMFLGICYQQWILVSGGLDGTVSDTGGDLGFYRHVCAGYQRTAEHYGCWEQQGSRKQYFGIYG